MGRRLFLDGWQFYPAFRAEMVRVGLWASAALIVVHVAGVLETPDRPQRALIAGLLGGGAVVTAIIWSLPAAAIVRSRWCGPFFLAWSVGDIALISTHAAVDGGLASPAVAGLFCTLVFASLSYPFAGVAFVAVLSLLALAALAVFVDPVTYPFDGSALSLVGGDLLIVALMCLQQARINAHVHDQLQRLSTRDHLTGVLNRRGFEATLAGALAGPRGGALLMLDLDGFKAINDSRGHAAGDAVLRDLGREAQLAVRAEDVVGRLGGDEFAILLPGLDAAGADRIAFRLSARLGAVALSHGVATYPDEALDADRLLALADARLYDVKAERRA